MRTLLGRTGKAKVMPMRPNHSETPTRPNRIVSTGLVPRSTLLGQCRFGAVPVSTRAKMSLGIDGPAAQDTDGPSRTDNFLRMFRERPHLAGGCPKAHRVHLIRIFSFGQFIRDQDDEFVRL